MNEFKLNECCWYPAAAFKLENWPRTASTLLEELSTWTWNLSNAVVVVVSAVSMCSQKLSVAEVAVEGIVTVWVTVSVWVVP